MCYFHGFIVPDQMTVPDPDTTQNIILVPTDFSEVCGNAVVHAAKLAQFLNYKLVILHILDKKTKAQLKKMHAGTEFIENQLDHYTDVHGKKYGIVVETLIKEGTIFTSINKTAADLNAALMVVGTHGKKGLQYLTGSYILKVADKSPVPVIVVRKRAIHENYNNILVPVTHELHPEKKIAWAKYFSRMFDANLHLYQYFYKDKLQNQRLAACMEKIRQSLDKDKIPYQVRKAEKETNFSSGVLTYAVSNRCDLLMIIDVNHNVSSTAWYEGLLYNREEIPVMTINLATIKKTNR
jgi:nucleotide-binding universal stress UspA family protein